MSVQALAERPPYTPPVILPGSDPVTAAVVPPELKAYFYMIRSMVTPATRYSSSAAPPMGMITLRDGGDRGREDH